MINKFSGWDDTIIAPMTGAGISAVAVIRLCGTKAFEIADSIFPSKKISAQAANTLHVGLLRHQGEEIDEAVLAVFRAPKSYTGEDTVEISSHGSAHIQRRIISACVSCGARPARAGEFTQRAFLNGKMDLVQAEAVADIIAAETDAAKNSALKNIRGGFSHTLSNLREQLISFAALIELELDFAGEDVEFADRKKLYSLIAELSKSTEALIDSFRLGNVIKNGVRVAIIGRPNAGKSTLLNALLNEERAIVSEIAGTTRDTIEEMLNIKGILFRLIDTAGIRARAGDMIEKLGIERAHSNAASADLVLHVLEPDNTTLPGNADDISSRLQENGKAVIKVMNKADLQGADSSTSDNEKIDIRIAAKTGEGIEGLKEMMYDFTIAGNRPGEGTIVTNERHLDSLKKIAESLTQIKQGLDNNLPGDLLSSDIRTALYWLGEITGEITNEDKLDFIFSKFCIGK